jgi:hypothetical protein
MKPATAVDLGRLGLDRGGHLLLGRALASVDVGHVVEVRGCDSALGVHLRGWCRAHGHRVIWPEDDAQGWVGRIVRGAAQVERWHDAQRAGDPDARNPGAVVEHPSPTWGLAGRGARVEAGSPPFSFPLRDKKVVWAREAASLYAQAAAAQWDPATAIDWDAAFELPDEIEDAVVQIMTYLIENETAALVIPARFAGQIHPHFREVVQLLAIQAADEARHIEVFTRRALLRRSTLGLSTAGGQASLKTLLDEPDFALASFMLSVLGEGSFLSLLWFIHAHAPDPVTRQVARLAAQDEARHVAFGLAHLSSHIEHDDGLRGRLTMAVERRHDALQHTAGLNSEVFDALVLLAAGSWTPEALEAGWDAVVALQGDMDEGRRKRLRRLGFADDEATHLSSLHTRNFM